MGTTLQLSVLDDKSLIYTWYVASGPADAQPVTFTPNGVNAAKNTIATIRTAGSYVFQATIRNERFQTLNCGGVTVAIQQTLTTIDVSPANVTIAPGSTQQFTAIAKDQFDNPMAPQPVFVWSALGGIGVINRDGLYTAPNSGSVATIGASSGGVSKTATVTIMGQYNGIFFDTASGVLTLRTNCFGNTILIRPDPFDSTQLNVTMSGTDQSGQLVLNAAKSFPISSMKSILLYGQSAFNITFNNATAIPCTAWAGFGANGFYGGSNQDTFYGGSGNNTFYGGPGDDTLVGGTGNNYLYGGSGKNTLRPGPGPGLNFMFPNS